MKAHPRYVTLGLELAIALLLVAGILVLASICIGRVL